MLYTYHLFLFCCCIPLWAYDETALQNECRRVFMFVCIIPVGGQLIAFFLYSLYSWNIFKGWGCSRLPYLDSKKSSLTKMIQCFIFENLEWSLKLNVLRLQGPPQKMGFQTWLSSVRLTRMELLSIWEPDTPKMWYMYPFLELGSSQILSAEHIHLFANW